jgi:hypothetical protein
VTQIIDLEGKGRIIYIDEVYAVYTVSIHKNFLSKVLTYLLESPNSKDWAQIQTNFL